jgi:hypothetical protein
MGVDLSALFEPGVHEGFDWEHAPQVSLAISAKRIADALERISQCADGVHPSAFRVFRQD